MVHPWQCGRESDRAHIGLAAEPFDERSLRPGHLLTLRGTNVERDRQDLLGSNPVAGLAWLRCLDFAPQAPSDADGHDGDGDINHDERARQPAQAIARPARPGALDVRIDRPARHADGGHDARDDGATGGQNQSAEYGGRVQPRIDPVRKRDPQRGQQATGEPVEDQQSGTRRHDSQHHELDKDLREDASAARPQCRPHGELRRTS